MIAKGGIAARLSDLRGRDFIWPLTFVLATGVYLLAILRTAWLADDAFITFRSIMLLGADLGPNYNAAERVMVFTHPLWYGLLAMGFYVFRDIHLVAVSLSIAVSLAVPVFLIYSQRDWLATGVLTLASLALSRAFVDYSTSGLENPLSHLLLAVFWFLAQNKKIKTQYWRTPGLLFVAGLAGLNRLDTLLLYFPLLLSVMWVDGQRRTRLVGLSALIVPLGSWILFSMFYYGFPFPNTAYAKLNTGIPRLELIARGIAYLRDSLDRDPLTLLVIALFAISTFRLARSRMQLLALGVFLYLSYVVAIGGDFMSGRFLTLPFLAAVCGLASELDGRRLFPGLATAFVLLVGLLGPAPPILSGPDYGPGDASTLGPNGVADERAYYYPYTGLLRANQYQSPATTSAARDARNAIETQDAVVVRGTLGFYGFYVGRGVHVIDRTGLADPLLARLTPRIEAGWRIAHLDREIPEGYLETLETGRNQIASQPLAEYYDHLSLVIRGPLWSGERLNEIVRFNLGMYDHLIAEYAREAARTVGE